MRFLITVAEMVWWMRTLPLKLECVDQTVGVWVSLKADPVSDTTRAARAISWQPFGAFIQGTGM